jgi:hypothetical protein
MGDRELDVELLADPLLKYADGDAALSSDQSGPLSMELS